MFCWSVLCLFSNLPHATMRKRKPSIEAPSDIFIYQDTLIISDAELGFLWHYQAQKQFSDSCSEELKRVAWFWPQPSKTILSQTHTNTNRMWAAQRRAKAGSSMTRTWGTSPCTQLSDKQEAILSLFISSLKVSYGILEEQCNNYIPQIHLQHQILSPESIRCTVAWWAVGRRWLLQKCKAERPAPCTATELQQYKHLPQSNWLSSLEQPHQHPSKPLHSQKPQHHVVPPAERPEWNSTASSHKLHLRKGHPAPSI